MDILELYRWAVQDPETHATVLGIMYEQCRGGRKASVLREDFAGTSAESVAWVALDGDRRAIAVDLDARTLAWARDRAARLLSERAGQVEFVEGDVLEVAPPRVAPADIVSVLNFSMCYFHRREALLTYLRHARESLAPGGLLVCNLFGGADAIRRRVDRRKVTPAPRLSSEKAIAPFEYEWEHRSYDAVSGRLDCRIHFSVSDEAGAIRELRDAFTYDFRLWGIPEFKEAVREAGFADVQVWRHTYDASRGAAGVFLGSVDSIGNEAAWTAYIVAAA
jgi:SAM-dependent methyltransferase